VASAVDQAFVLDRALLELQLRRRAAEAGAEMVEGALVTRARVSTDVCETKVSGPDGARTYASRVLVVASGVNPGLLRQAGLGQPAKYMVGAHAEVEMDGVDETEVYFLSDVAPGAFAWLVPMAPGRVRLGVLSASLAAQVAGMFLARPGVRDRVRRQPLHIAQRPVPVAVSRRMHGERVLAVGDAAGQVKPTTGGGLYLGAMAAAAAAAVLAEALARDDLSARALSRYEAQWRSAFGGELRRGALARAVYSRLSAGLVDGVIELAARTGVAETLLRSPSFSFDRHSGALLSGLLRCLPGALLHPAGRQSEAES
jgi:flavin-dependent dehydrogenase